MKSRMAMLGLTAVTLAVWGPTGVGPVLAGKCYAGPAAVTPTATPARPATPDEQALGAHIGALQAQMAAVTAGRFSDYEDAMKRLTAPLCRFYSVSGRSASRARFLTGEQKTFAGAAPGMTESIKTLTLAITGTTALQTGVATDDANVVDAAGRFGAKGQSHHWQQMTFFRVHWVGPAAGDAVAPTSGIQPSTWKAEEFAFTDVQTFLDGSPYLPPQRPVPTPRNSTSLPRTPKTVTRRPRVRRYPYVISGGRYYSF